MIEIEELTKRLQKIAEGITEDARKCQSALSALPTINPGAATNLMQRLEDETAAIEAIRESFARLLSDERLIKTPHNHADMAEIFDSVMNQPLMNMKNALADVSNKRRAARGGLGKRANSEIEKKLARKYYLEHRNIFKNKDDAAMAIEGKTIDGRELKASAATIRGYLRGA